LKQIFVEFQSARKIIGLASQIKAALKIRPSASWPAYAEEKTDGPA